LSFRLNNQINKVNEDFKQIILEKENYIRKLDKTNKELKHYKEVNNGFFEENNELKNEINKLSYKLNELELDKHENLNKKGNLSSKLKVLEEELSFCASDKQYYAQLAIRITKTYPLKEMYRIINKLIENKEALNQLKEERIKLESIIGQKDKYLKQTNKTENDKNERKLQNLFSENENKIYEKQKVVKDLESDMKIIEHHAKTFNDDFSKNEFKIKELLNDLNSLEEEYINYRDKASAGNKVSQQQNLNLTNYADRVFCKPTNMKSQRQDSNENDSNNNFQTINYKGAELDNKYCYNNYDSNSTNKGISINNDNLENYEKYNSSRNSNENKNK